MPVSSNVRRPKLQLHHLMHFSFQLSFTSQIDFLQHWASKYHDPNEMKYLPNVGKKLSSESLHQLFEWKNGSGISRRKLHSIAANYPLVFEGDPANRYLNHNNPGGAIWNIFYLHCLDPKKWPIFDQHTFRAMHYLRNGQIREIGSTNKLKYFMYQFEYIPFLKEFSEPSQRRIDMALFTFGKFLKLAKGYA